MQIGYLQLKLSWALFQKVPEALSATEQKRLNDVAQRQQALEQRILGSAEAARVVLPQATLQTRLNEIKARYPDETEYRLDLERLGIAEAELEALIARDVRVETVLEKVALTVATVNEVDAEIYYRLHPEAFDRPPARRLRHILLTFNNAQERQKASALLDGLRARLNSPEKFAEAALRHSQCPTAVDGGMLGLVKRQQLYAELEPAAFALEEGEISTVLESPIGLHILRCDEILPDGMIPFPEVCAQIMARLSDKRRKEKQRDWIRGLK